MKQGGFILVGLCIGLLLTDWAAAQRVNRRDRDRSRDRSRDLWYAPRGDYGPVYPPYGYRASTPVEGARRGMADVIRAGGEASESYSRASINSQEARRRWIENEYEFTKMYWDRKRLGQAERLADFERDRARRQAYRDSRTGTGSPPALDPTELDPVTGEIAWPDALLQDKYATQRDQLNELLSLKTSAANTPGLSRKIYESCREMQTALLDEIRDMPAHEYIAARKFLDSLAMEGRRG